jgi:hypothetical protein
MLVYFTNLIVVVLAAFLARKSKSKILSRFLLGIAFASMVLVAGMRNKSVGTDTSNYVRFFNNIQTFSDAMAFGDQMQEYGFWILNWLVHFVSNDYMVLFFAFALIVIGCSQRAIVAYSESIEISFFVFITMGTYLFFFNGARQGIACAIYSLAIGQMLKRNFIKYLGYVLLAFLFHKTAIMMVPVYFVLNRSNTFKNNLFTIVIGCVTVLFIDSIVGAVSSIDARYAQYGTAGGGGGYFTFGFSCVLGIFFMIFKNSIRIDRYRYDRFLNMFLFGIMIGMVATFLGTDPSGLLRYGSYFNLAVIFMWPIVFKNLTDRLSRFVVGYSFVIFYLIFFVMTTQRFSNLIPYIFNPSLSTLFK